MTHDIWLFTHKRMLLETHQCVHVFHSDRWIERISLEVTMVPSILRKLPGETERSPDILWVLQGFILGGCFVGFFLSNHDAVEPRVWRGELLEPARTAEGFGVCEGAPAVRQLPSNSLEGWDGKNEKSDIFFGSHLLRVKFECSKDAKLRDTDEILFKVLYHPRWCRMLSDSSIMIN